MGSPRSEAAVQFVRTIVMKHRLLLSVFLVTATLCARTVSKTGASHLSRVEVTSSRSLVSSLGEVRGPWGVALTMVDAPTNQSAPGVTGRGDFLSRLLHQEEIGWGAMIVGLLAAFGLG